VVWVVGVAVLVVEAMEKSSMRVHRALGAAVLVAVATTVVLQGQCVNAALRPLPVVPALD
jgi:hypothetical protein